jgi:predicted P-loop ATPase
MMLGKHWYSDSVYTMQGKDAYEQIQGAWVIELSEMAAARKAEMEQIKHFISKQVDSFRPAYGRNVKDYPRQCAFFGTTNDDEFMRDTTGNRRFWPVAVKGGGPEITTDEIDQIWAEAYFYYDLGETWYLGKALEKEAIGIQEQYTERNSMVGEIEEFMAREIPEDWYKRARSERQEWWQNQDRFGESWDGEGQPDTSKKKQKGMMKRTRVCALEIWSEMLGERKKPRSVDIREINSCIKKATGWPVANKRRFGPGYGEQRCFVSPSGGQNED